MLRVGAGVAVLVLGASLLAGCSDIQGDVGNRNIKPNSVLQDGNGNKVLDKRFANDQFNEQNRVYGRRLNSNNLIGRHQNYRMEMGQEIADEISRAEGVGDVYVILTDRNAYVAVGSGKAAGDREAGAVRTGQAESGHADAGTGNVGTGNVGTGNVGTGNVGTGAAGTDIAYPRMVDAPDRGHDTDPLRNGMGMRSSRTDSREGLPSGTSGMRSQSSGGKLEERVAAHVKRMAPQIEQVYVSRQPDFVSRMNGYAETARGGEPIQGYIAEFNAMVERIFPVESGIRISRTGDSWFHD